MEIVQVFLLEYIQSFSLECIEIFFYIIVSHLGSGFYGMSYYY